MYLEDLIKSYADIKIVENYIKQMKMYEEDKIHNNKASQLGITFE